MSRVELEAELQESRTQHSEATSHVRSLLRTMSAMAEENSALKEQVKVVHARASEVAQDATSSAGAYSKLQTEAASATLVQAQQRKEMIQAFKQESQQFKRAASTMEATMRRLASEKSKLASELERISDERENMRSEAEATRTALRDSRSQIVTLKQRIVRLAGGSSLPHEMFGEEHVHIPGRGGGGSVGRATSGGRSTRSGAGTVGGQSVKSIMGGKRLGQSGLHALDLETMLMALPPAMQLMWKEKQDALNAALQRADDAEGKVDDLQSHLSSLQGEYMLVAAGEDDSLMQRLKRRQLAAGFKPGEGRNTLHHPTQMAVAQRVAQAVAQARESGNRDCLDVALYGAILGEPSLDDIHSVEVTPVGEETPLPKPLAASAAAYIYTAAVEGGDTLALSDTRRSGHGGGGGSAPHEGAAVLHKLMASSSRPMGSTSTRDVRSKGGKDAADVAERTVVVLRLLLAQSKAIVAVLRDQLKTSLAREHALHTQLDEAHQQLDPLLLTMEQAHTQAHLRQEAADAADSGNGDPSSLVAQRNALLKYSRQLEQREARLMEQVASLTDSVNSIRVQLTDEAFKQSTGAQVASDAEKMQEAKEALQQHPTAVLLEELQKAQQSGAVSHGALSAATNVTSQLRQLQVCTPRHNHKYATYTQTA